MEWIQVFEGELPGGGSQFIPTPCQQCQNPPCVNVCPVGATFSTPEGTVLIDQNRCIGCRICMAACPYDRRFFNWGTAPVPPESLLADYSPEHQVPMKRGTVTKCDFCPAMRRTGTLPYRGPAWPNRALSARRPRAGRQQWCGMLRHRSPGHCRERLRCRGP